MATGPIWPPAPTRCAGSWSDYGSDRESVLAAIDGVFGENSAYAALWRSIYLAGISLNGCHNTSVGEFDFTNGSGWLYTVGGGTYYPDTTLSNYELQDGDVLVRAIRWPISATSAAPIRKTRSACPCSTVR